MRRRKLNVARDERTDQEISCGPSELLGCGCSRTKQKQANCPGHTPVLRRSPSGTFEFDYANALSSQQPSLTPPIPSLEASLHRRQRSTGDALDPHPLSSEPLENYQSNSSIAVDMLSPRSATYDRLETGKGPGNPRQGMLRNLGWKKIALGVTCLLGVVWVFQRNGNGKEDTIIDSNWGKSFSS